MNELKIDLVSILKEKGITPYQLSKKTGIKTDTIYRYYKNKLFRIDLHNLSLMCHALQCNPEQIIRFQKK